MSENKTIYYQNGTFSVEDNLFYENNIRIGYFEDEEKEEILENNHNAVVDRLTNLRDSNIDLKRSNKKLRKENNELRKENYGNLDGLNYYQEENASLSEKISNLEYDLDYYRAKSGSCEEGLFQKDKEIAKLEKENKELNSIKCFADNNGINIFNIDEAFRKCWNDNEKLVLENKELQERNNRQAKQLDDIYRLIEEKDWRALSDILDDFKRNDEQLQKEWKCYE